MVPTALGQGSLLHWAGFGSLLGRSPGPPAPYTIVGLLAVAPLGAWGKPQAGIAFEVACCRRSHQQLRLELMEHWGQHCEM